MKTDRPIDWQQCITCGKRHWLQNHCRYCLDQLRQFYANEPENIAEAGNTSNGRTQGKCSVWWCEWEAKGKHDVCAHHLNNPCEEHLLDALSIDDAAAAIGVSKVKIFEWRDEGRLGFIEYRGHHALIPQQWMFDYAEALYEEPDIAI